MELSNIYESISADLLKVDEILDSVSQVDVAWLREMLDHSIKGGGKRIRPVLTLMAGKFYNYNLDALLPMATSVELMHTATLVHDDAIDKSPVRRGRPTINKIWGDEQAVLLGDYLFAKAGDVVADTQSIPIVKLFCQTLMIISRGELDQARNAFNPNQAREQYFNRIFSKTASLFSLSTESGGILSRAPKKSVKALKEFGVNLGMAFQIVDDILDFTSTEKELGKPAGSDLTQGTLTLPAMLFLEHYPGEDNPVKWLFQKRDGLKLVELTIQRIRNSTIVDECYLVATDYSDRACRYLEELPDNPNRQALCELARFVISRKK